MRATIFVFCAAVLACARQDQPAPVSKPVLTVAVASSTPVVDSQPAARGWPAPPPAPGDTTPQGYPTEAALLRWVHRLPPDSFPLPKVVHDSLVKWGCEVPTPWPSKVNVVTGAFTAKGAVEWAVLCSVRDTSQILILNAANGAVVDSLLRSADVNWVQGNGGNTWLFSRYIAVVSMSDLNVVPTDTTSEEGPVYYGAFLPKPIDHDAIDQAFLDKASTTFYFAQGKWFEVGSSD